MQCFYIDQRGVVIVRFSVHRSCDEVDGLFFNVPRKWADDAWLTNGRVRPIKAYLFNSSGCLNGGVEV